MIKIKSHHKKYLDINIFLWKDNVTKITCRYLNGLEINLTLVKTSSKTTMKIRYRIFF